MVRDDALMQLLILIGPPAVGKMTIGRQIAAASDFRLFHNHLTIEPLIEVFGYGTPGFKALDIEFRRRMIEEAARARLNLIFTAVWDFADLGDTRYAEYISEPYAAAGAPVGVAELRAPLDVRLARNHGEDRIAAKPSKRDLEWSDQNLLAMERHTLTSDGADVAPEALALLDRLGHAQFDTTERSPAQTASGILAWLDSDRR